MKDKRLSLNEWLAPIRLLLPQAWLHSGRVLLSNREVKLRILLRYLDGKVLDIGCGNNELIKVYLSRGGEGYGIDICVYDASSPPDMVVEDSAQLEWDDGSFDTITFVSSINHIDNKKEVLKEARRLLGQSGKLIITNLGPIVGFVSHWTTTMQYYITGKRAWKKHYGDTLPDIVRGLRKKEELGLSKKHLVKLVEQAGFVFNGARPFSWGLNSLYFFKPR